MGHSISKYAHTDPRQFASPKESDAAQWREYDYVVVGGGKRSVASLSARGLTLAFRYCWLRPGGTVERGPERHGVADRGWKEVCFTAPCHGRVLHDRSEDFVTTIPFAFTKTFKSPVDWAFKTTYVSIMCGASAPY